MHKCKNCGEKDLDKFGIHATSKRPYGYCKVCRYARHKETSKKYFSSIKGKAVKAVSDKKYYLENKDRISNYNKKYRLDNKKSLSEKRRVKYLLNKKSILLSCSEYKKNNKDIVNKSCAKRRASKLKSSPEWGRT